MVKNITVFGAGLMGMSCSSCIETRLMCFQGAGIAQVAAQHGFKVVLSDVTEVCSIHLVFPLVSYANVSRIAQKALQNGRQYIQKSLRRVAKKKFAGREGEIDGWTGEVLEDIKMVTDP